jgi:putative CocE/NonD family hydrolase
MRMRKKTKALIFSIGVLGLALYGLRKRLLAWALKLGPAQHRVGVERGLITRMPDGVALVADHFYPKTGQACPAILIRTPYGRSRAVGPVGWQSEFAARRFAERGYHVLVQDVRGRFDSQGEFQPFYHEAEDGLATLRWLEHQPWFNGDLGMWGQSYVGYVQWALAAKAPRRLQAMVPGITSARLPKTTFRQGALSMDTLFRWIFKLDLMDRQGRLSKIKGLIRILPWLEDRLLENAFWHLPLWNADEQIVQHPVAFYREWMAHPDGQEAYWQVVDHSPALGEIDARVHLISGWFDIFLGSLLQDYQDLVSSGRQPYLTIGPWSHINFNAMAETLRQGLIWFDRVLKCKEAILRPSPVRIYVMAGNGGQWRDLETWPPTTQQQTLFLDESSRLSFDLPVEESPPDQYTYDPSNPTPAVGGAMMNLHAGPKDNRALEARPDVLIYTTGVLQSDLEVIGSARAVLYVSSSLEYTDFFARLCDVLPGGASLNVCDAMLRIQPGVGQPMPDGSLRIEIELFPTAYCFQSGHQLRLQISSGAHPRWSRNLGTAGSASTAAEMKIAHQRVYHDPTHISTLTLPVFQDNL